MAVDVNVKYISILVSKKVPCKKEKDQTFKFRHGACFCSQYPLPKDNLVFRKSGLIINEIEFSTA